MTQLEKITIRSTRLRDEDDRSIPLKSSKTPAHLLIKAQIRDSEEYETN